MSGALQLTPMCILRIADVDDFIAQLWKIHVAVQKEGYTQVH